MMSDEHVHQTNIQLISQTGSETGSPASVQSPKVMAINAPHGYGELSTDNTSSHVTESEVKLIKNVPQSETLQLEITTPASTTHSRPSMEIFSVDPKEDEQFIALAKKDEEEDLFLQEFVENVDELDVQRQEPKHKKTLPRKLGRTDSVVTVELSREASPSLDNFSPKEGMSISSKPSQSQFEPGTLLSVPSNSSLSSQLQEVSSLIVEPSTTAPSVISTPSELTSETPDKMNTLNLDDINLDDADFVVVSLDQEKSPILSDASPKHTLSLPPPPPILSKQHSPDASQQHRNLPEVPLPGARKIPPPPLKSSDLEKHNLPIALAEDDDISTPPFGLLKEPTIGHHIDAAPIIAHIHVNHDTDADKNLIVVKLEPNSHYKYSIPGMHVHVDTSGASLPSKHPLPPPPPPAPATKHHSPAPLPPVPSKSPTVAPVPSATTASVPVSIPVASDHFQFELISKSGNSPTVIVHLAPQHSIIAPSSTAILYYDPSIQIAYAPSEKTSFARAFESLFNTKNTNEGTANSIRFYQNNHVSKVKPIAFYSSPAFSEGDIIPIDMDKLFPNGLFVKQDSFLLGSASTFFHHEKESIKYFGTKLKGISIPFQRIRSKGLVFLQSPSGSIFARELQQGDDLLLESASINCVIAFSHTITYTFDIDMPSLSHIGNVSMSKLKISGPGVVYFQSRPSQ